ncbi:VOC family protein [Actinoplanes sp. CA-142083]|uniref:VOC family protein n=1 Tax=Actinoplanes sp. CA-142083 TaxID=3239903 RepID=UPI003D8B4030
MNAPFVWFDLTGGEGGTAAEFYQGLFGWQTAPGAGGYAAWFADEGQPWGGVISGGGLPPGRWLPYVLVPDLDTATKQAVELGGRVVRDKTTGPAGTSVVIADPGDGLVALFVPAG